MTRARATATVSALVAVVAVVAVVAALGHGASGPRWRVPGGDADRGAAAIGHYGCGACHTIPGIRKADAVVGPPLTGIADRAFVAGKLPNGPAALETWIMDPQRIVPGNAMPDMGVTPQDARDIVAYLAQLR
jgi:cytochrome c2